MRVIAKKRCRVMVEPPEKGERATLNPNLSTRLKPTFFRSGPLGALTSHRPDERPSELTRNSRCQNTGRAKDPPPLGGVLATAAWQRSIARSKKIATATWWLQ